ncbi:hypothetical protein [Bowmanella sp. JS7-9]|uniref:HTH araC/xylS-type domain-containing protein n=1 Tax=Pseudobowmanella zhangzhouensis TaxID=1537679 RepID=A0ABW1XL19_9ALTE|nr:hypothetical protein [Bowmanella sp. JS7-9]TBX22069.1 hypothetical protein TK45_11415 [Bowmanella sp. JS7-9]
MQGQSTYSAMLLMMAALWAIPLLITWWRFDRLIHSKSLLLLCLFAPFALLDEWLISSGQYLSGGFLLGISQCLFVMLLVLCAQSVRDLCFEKQRNANVLLLLPVVFALLLLPFLTLSQSQKFSLLGLQAVPQDVSLLWLLCPGLIVLCAMGVWIMAREDVQHFHRLLPRQVADPQLYRLTPLLWGLGVNLLIVSVCLLTWTLALSGQIDAHKWLVLSKMALNAGIWLMAILLASVGAQSPLPDLRSRVRLSPTELRQLHSRIETVLEQQQAYRFLGLRIRDVASLVNASPAQIDAALASQGIRHFRGYVNGKRIRYARQRLLTSDDSVTGLTRQLGFPSERWLSDVFVSYVQRLGRLRLAYRQSQG